MRIVCTLAIIHLSYSAVSLLTMSLSQFSSVFSLTLCPFHFTRFFLSLYSNNCHFLNERERRMCRRCLVKCLLSLRILSLLLIDLLPEWNGEWKELFVAHPFERGSMNWFRFRFHFPIFAFRSSLSSLFFVHTFALTSCFDPDDWPW